MGALIRRPARWPVPGVIAALLVAGLAVTGNAPARAEARAIRGCAPAESDGGEWRSYGHDYANTRTQPDELTLGGIDVATLAPAWTFSSMAAGGEGDFTGNPIVADGCVFAGSNRGWVYAMNADTGALVWKTKVPGGGGINASLYVSQGRIYAAVSRVGRPYVIALRETDGRLIWGPRVTDTQPGADVFGSPVVWNGLLLIGVSGGSAELSTEAERYPFHGALLLIDSATGKVLKKTWTIPRSEWAKGFAGATIWTTPAIDTEDHVAYAGTGNPFKPSFDHPHADAVLKFDLDRGHKTFGQIIGFYRGTPEEYVPGLAGLPCYDIPGNPPPYYPQGLGGCGDVDLDFGANPNLFRDATGRKLVGNGQKSGVYHAFDAKTMKRAWSTAVGFPSAVGGIVGSTAYDGARIYGPVTQGGYLWALDSVRGTNGWIAPVADGAHYGQSVAVANGVVYTVDLKGFLDAFDGRNGLPLLHRPLLLGSATGANPVLSWGNVSVARHTVYAGVGVTALANGFIIALRPGGGGGSGAPAPGPSLPPLPAGPTVVAGPGAYVSTYATPAVVMPQGGTLSFVNADVPQHDVTAVTKRNGKPIFNSKLVGLGEVTPVNGVDKLASGNYAFYCTIHPGMTGTLAVL